MLIDFHTHIFPDAIAEGAVKSLAAKGNITPYGSATVADTAKKMAEWGVDYAVMLSIATNAKQMKKVNDFAASVNSERMIAFGSVFPDAPDAFDELDRVKELGLAGVKFHPEYQGFHAERDEYLKLYEKCAKLGLIMVFHAGRDVAYPDTVMAPPKALSIACDSVPDGKFVFAHMGGFNMFSDVIKYLVGSSAYFDTAVVDQILDPRVAETIIRGHGSEKILFGTDCPWGTVPVAKAYVESLDLTEEERENIFFRNAKRLLGIE